MFQPMNLFQPPVPSKSESYMVECGLIVARRYVAGQCVETHRYTASPANLVRFGMAR